MTMKKIYIFIFAFLVFFFLKVDAVKAESPMELKADKEYTFTLSGGEGSEFICNMPYGRELDNFNFCVTDVQIESNELKLYDRQGPQMDYYEYFNISTERLVCSVGNIEAVAYNGISHNKMLSTKYSIFYYKDKRNCAIFKYDPWTEYKPNCYYTFKINIDPGFKVSFKLFCSTKAFDRIEKENNDTFKKANKLKYDLYKQVGTEKIRNYMHEYFGTLKKKDVDYFKFTAPKSGKFGFIVYAAGKDIPKNKYLKTTVYKKNKKQLKMFKSYNYKKTINDIDKKNIHYMKKLKKGETVYIKIEPGNTTGWYGLIVHDDTVSFGF